MIPQISRRDFLSVAALTTAGVALVACFKKKEQPLQLPTETVLLASPPPPSGPTSLNFWGWSNPVWLEIVQKFMEQNSRITLNVSELGGAVFGDPKFQASLAAGTGPDVALQNRHTFMKPAAQNLYRDIAPFMEPMGLSKSDFTPVQIEETSWNGKIFGLPLFADVRYLYWNKKQFEDVGLDPTKPPTTWAELEAYTDKLNIKNDQGDMDRIGFVPYLFGNSWMWLYGFLNKAPAISDDKRTILCDDPRWSDALDWMVKFYDNHIGSFELANAFSEAITAAGLGDPFAAGKVAMTATGDWQVGDFLRTPEIDWDCAPMPIPLGGGKSTWSCGWSIVMSLQSEKDSQSFTFMKWLATEPGWEAFSDATFADIKQVWERDEITGEPKFWPTMACYLPALKMLEEKYVRLLDEREQKAWAMGIDALQNWTHGCGAEMGVAALEYWIEMDNAVRTALFHQSSPREAMAECKRKAQEATNRAWGAIDS